MRSGPRGFGSFAAGKLMIPRFSHDVSIEIAMQGIGTHKSGPKWPRMRIVGDYYYFLNTRGAHRVDFGTQ